jgi:hypothetical protein
MHTIPETWKTLLATSTFHDTVKDWYEGYIFKNIPLDRQWQPLMLLVLREFEICANPTGINKAVTSHFNKITLEVLPTLHLRLGVLHRENVFHKPQCKIWNPVFFNQGNTVQEVSTLSSNDNSKQEAIVVSVVVMKCGEEGDRKKKKMKLQGEVMSAVDIGCL